MAFKYIIVESMGLELPRIGSKIEKHEDLKKYHEKPVAGGFLDMIPIDRFGVEAISFSCYGESVGLGVKSRGKEDAILIDKLFNR